MKHLASIALAALTLGSQAFAQAAPDIAGTWLTKDGRAKIRTEHCGEGGQKLCGFVVWMEEPLDEGGHPKLDVNNPDPAKRSRPSLGLELMTGLKSEDSTHYSGEIYNADDGKMYSVTLSTDSADELKVRGCLVRILCGSQTWTRVADIAVPTAAGKVATSGAAAKVPAKPAPSKHDTVPAPK